MPRSLVDLECLKVACPTGWKMPLGFPLTPQMAGECPARWRQKRAEDEFARRAVEEEKIPGLDVTKGHSEGFILGL